MSAGAKGNVVRHQPSPALPSSRSGKNIPSNLVTRMLPTPSMTPNAEPIKSATINCSNSAEPRVSNPAHKHSQQQRKLYVAKARARRADDVHQEQDERVHEFADERLQQQGGTTVHQFTVDQDGRGDKESREQDVVRQPILRRVHNRECDTTGEQHEQRCHPRVVILGPSQEDERGEHLRKWQSFGDSGVVGCRNGS